MFDLRLFGWRRVAFVAATELNECGLACLAAVSESLGGEAGMAEIRGLAAHSGRGETLLDIRNLAEQIGLAARGVRVGLHALRELVTPTILHWDMNHFVVLERVTRRGIMIMDPAAGRMEVGWSEVNKSFTGMALELKPSATWKVRTGKIRKVSVLDFIGPFSQWRTDVVLVVALSLMLELLVLLGPMQARLAIDVALQGGDLAFVWALAIGFSVVVLIQSAVSVVRAWTIAVFSARVGYELKDRFARALHGKPARFFLKHHSADLLSRGRSVDMIQNLVTAQLLQGLLDAVMSVAIVAVLLVTVPVMGAVVVVFGLLNVGTTGWLRYAAIEISRRSLRVAAKADALFLENARAARAIKLFGKEIVRTSVWRQKVVELTNLVLVDGRLMLFSTQAALLTNGLGNVALITTGTYLVVSGAITLGTMVMVFMLRTFVVERLTNCVNYLMELRRVRAHAERIDEVITDDLPNSANVVHQPFSSGDDTGLAIELRNVWFRYGNDSPWILKGVSFKIDKGQTVAISGPSGSGKTTLMNVMLGLLEPSRGEVIINGRDLRSISSADYAKVIGVVMQDDILFQGTVAENICFFDAPMDLGRVAESARAANVADDIEAMPMKYYSLLAESGMDISGGQKQRLFIARAVYHEPKILFLDEATSHLDSGAERLVSEAVRAMQMTRVLIAHRKETIATAERELVVDPKSGTVQERLMS